MRKRLGILGCGQLAQMLAHAARRLDLDVCFLTLDETPLVGGIGEVFEVSELDQFLTRVDAVTVEREAIPEAILRRVADQRPLAPGYDALLQLRSRHSQKALFDDCHLPTAQWCLVNSADELPAALAGFDGERVRAKRVLGGYDGGGQWRLDLSQDDVRLPEDAFPVILEAEIAVEEEVSVLIARARDGSVQCYPLNHNLMRDGILTWSFVPAAISDTVADQIRGYATSLVNAIEYVGVLAMECFISQGRVLVNEIAPRVHNTGHWTIEGCECDQFEQHVRAVMGMSLRDTLPAGAAAMCNLLGDSLPTQLPPEGVRMYVHAYGKSLRPGRKMGHVTLIAENDALIRQGVQQIGLSGSD